HRAPHEPVDPVRVDVGVAAAGEVDRRQGQAGGLVALPVAGDDVPGDLESVAAGTVDRVAHSPIETAVKDLDGHVVGLGGGDVHAVPFPRPRADDVGQVAVADDHVVHRRG